MPHTKLKNETLLRKYYGAIKPRFQSKHMREKFGPYVLARYHSAAPPPREYSTAELITVSKLTQNGSQFSKFLREMHILDKDTAAAERVQREKFLQWKNGTCPTTSSIVEKSPPVMLSKQEVKEQLLLIVGNR